VTLNGRPAADHAAGTFHVDGGYGTHNETLTKLEMARKMATNACRRKWPHLLFPAAG
jgi:hypothetical protein